MRHAPVHPHDEGVIQALAFADCCDLLEGKYKVGRARFDYLGCRISCRCSLISTFRTGTSPWSFGGGLVAWQY